VLRLGDETLAFDPLNLVLALAVFAAIVVPFACWNVWRERRLEKMRAERDRAVQRLADWNAGSPTLGGSTCDAPSVSTGLASAPKNGTASRS
jgi:hypothetical protein